MDQNLIQEVFTNRAFDGSSEVRTEDGYIVSKCLNGESEAFGLLVDKYKEGIYAFIYAKLRDSGFRNFQDAQDVTQAVFIKAYEKLRALRWRRCVVITRYFLLRVHNLVLYGI